MQKQTFCKKTQKNGSSCRKVCSKDDKEVDGNRFAEKINRVDGKIGFIGTFDGRGIGHAFKNFNAANPFGLFLIRAD